MKKMFENKKMYPFFLGLGILFLVISTTSAVDVVDELIKCPFESINETHIVIDTTPDTSDGKYVQIIRNLASITPFKTRSYTLMGGEGIGLQIPRTIHYSSTQYTVPSTIVDMQLQTGLQKKIGTKWVLVAYKTAERDTTDELSQSGVYYASPGTYRTIGCHKVWEGGILVLHVDSWTAGELTVS